MEFVNWVMMNVVFMARDVCVSSNGVVYHWLLSFLDSSSSGIEIINARGSSGRCCG